MLDYSFDDTKILRSDPLVDVNDNVTTGAIDISGNRLPQARKHQIALNGNYSFFLDQGALTVGVTYIYRSDAYANVFSRDYNRAPSWDRDYNRAPSWDQVDLRAYWSPTKGNYTIIAYVKNVFETASYDAAVAGSQRNNSATVASDRVSGAGQNLELTPPPIYGVELQYRF